MKSIASFSHFFHLQLIAPLLPTSWKKIHQCPTGFSNAFPQNISTKSRHNTNKFHVVFLCAYHFPCSFFFPEIMVCSRCLHDFHHIFPRFSRLFPRSSAAPRRGPGARAVPGVERCHGQEPHLAAAILHAGFAARLRRGVKHS